MPTLRHFVGTYLNKVLFLLSYKCSEDLYTHRSNNNYMYLQTLTDPIVLVKGSKWLVIKW